MKHSSRMVLRIVQLSAATVAAVVMFTVVLNAITNPVEGANRSVAADFTDVAGLHVDGDVRTRGVLIGKVTAIDLVRRDGHSVAEVQFTLKEPYRLTENTVIAVKYQNLTGVRYLDLVTPAEPGKPTDHLTTASTKPSFDITQLFNGLQPVLNTMNTDEINTFTQNAISLLQGDGGGLAPIMDSVQKLGDYASDRQQVISTLTANLNRLADAMGGKSADLMDFLRSMSIPVARAMTVLDEFTKADAFGPAFTRPINQLLIDLGLTKELDVDRLVRTAFASVPAAAESLRLLPSAFAGLQLPPLASGSDAMSCSNGVAELPTDVRILLNGSEVIVCNAL
ncbi:MlaD family protein [Nocardia harenae]|uniref:MlaD family protein n=1 Tax=Nocardia harenae TaxID=358707 RepID=UPI000A7D47F3|nr:MlaD family protein [Nocardia harenae]